MPHPDFWNLLYGGRPRSKRDVLSDIEAAGSHRYSQRLHPLHRGCQHRLSQITNCANTCRSFILELDPIYAAISLGFAAMNFHAPYSCNPTMS